MLWRVKKRLAVMKGREQLQVSVLPTCMSDRGVCEDRVDCITIMRLSLNMFSKTIDLCHAAAILSQEI